MKKQTEKKILLGFIILCFIMTGFAIITLNTNESIKIKASEVKDDILKNPKSATTVYYDFNITIDNDNVECDWTWAEAQEWCSGDGSWATPYLIDDIEIYLNNTDTACINISNSVDVYFIISNCIVKNNASDYGIGIALTNCYHGIIDTVVANENGDDGIYLLNCMNITIDDSTMDLNHHYGLNMDNTTTSIITDSDLILNTLGGAYLLNSTYNLFQTTCEFDLSVFGIRLIDSDLNNISDCHFYNNTNYGLEILNSDTNYIFDSIFENNTLIGLYIYDEGGNSEYNLIKGNTFTTNGINAEDNNTGTINYFNSSTTGNSWDDVFTGQGITDLDDDGIGDTSYNISGSAGSKDYLPTLEDGDDVAPVVTIITPTSGQGFLVNPPTFSLIIVEVVGIYNRWYRVNDGTVTVFTGTTGTISTALWDAITGLPSTNAGVAIVFYVNDTSGNIGSASVSVIKGFASLTPEEEEKEEEAPPYFVEQVYICMSLIGLFAIFKVKKYWKKIT